MALGPGSQGFCDSCKEALIIKNVTIEKRGFKIGSKNA